ncbi:MAG: DUF4143 domain-containing protein [Gammaproteobacteria bacterium]|nr:DUF4143 domain-containing protein [Gammaproteobacteria bacterium]
MGRSRCGTRTVNSHVDYLAGAFLLRRLEAYHANIGKRLVKRPKVYWRDTGLLHSILNVEDADSLLSQPWVGASWEGYVIQQVISALEVKGVVHNAFYLRTSDQREIDLILAVSGVMMTMLREPFSDQFLSKCEIGLLIADSGRDSGIRIAPCQR